MVCIGRPFEEGRRVDWWLLTSAQRLHKCKCKCNLTKRTAHIGLSLRFCFTPSVLVWVLVPIVLVLHDKRPPRALFTDQSAASRTHTIMVCTYLETEAQTCVVDLEI